MSLHSPIAAYRWILGIIGLFVVLIAAAAIALALFDWNHARGWVSDKVKERTGRDLVIGELRVHPFSLHPKVHAEEVSLSNAEWGDKTPMIEADSIDFSVSLLPLIAGRVVFPDVALGEAGVCSSGIAKDGATGSSRARRKRPASPRGSSG